MAAYEFKLDTTAPRYELSLSRVGLQGSQGDKGEEGEQGEVGPRGEPGPMELASSNW
jgi:hypothetical protein